MKWIAVLIVVLGTTFAQLNCPSCDVRSYTINENCDANLALLPTKFVDPLPDLQLLPYVWNSSMNYPLYTLEMVNGSHNLHSELRNTTMWMYNGIFPGPLFEVESNQKIHVHIINNLPIDDGTPGRVLLPVNDAEARPADRAVVHLHGSISKPQYCGHPMDWVRPLPGKNSYINYHANQQPAGMLFYHDHAAKITGPNVYAGLAGIFLLRDDHERNLDLPRKEYELVLHVVDRNVDLATGQLIYDPNRGLNTALFQVVNGKIWPYRNVEPGRYRIRILNGANHRFYNFTFSNKMSFYQIGVDQGFLEKAVKVNYVFLGPAERADIIVDFNEARGKNIELLNQASNGTFPNLNAPFLPPGAPSTLCTSGSIMQFRVGRYLKKSDNHGKVPTKKLFDYVAAFPDLENVRVRKHVLRFNGQQFLINDAPFAGRVDPYIPLGSTEVWEFVNAIPTAHPMHVHMVGFFVVDRQPFNVTAFNQNPLGNTDVQYTAQPRLPPPTERGVKDVVVVFPNEVVRIAATFAPYAGEFVYHCHLLEHEDDDMMRRYSVTPVGPDCQWDDDQQDEDCSYYD